MRANCIKFKALMKIFPLILSFLVFLFQCDYLYAGNESPLNLNRIDDVKISELSNYFTIMHEKQNVRPEQISLDFSGSKLVSLTIQYTKVDYLQSLKHWVDKHLPNSLIAFTNKQGSQGGLWRSVENSVAVQLVISEEDSKLLLLIIGFKSTG